MLSSNSLSQVATLKRSLISSPSMNRSEPPIASSVRSKSDPPVQVALHIWDGALDYSCIVSAIKMRVFGFLTHNITIDGELGSDSTIL